MEQDKLAKSIQTSRHLIHLLVRRVELPILPIFRYVRFNLKISFSSLQWPLPKQKLHAPAATSAAATIIWLRPK